MLRLVSLAVIVLATTTNTSVVGAEIDSITVGSRLTYGYATQANRSIQGELEIVPAIDVALTPRSSLIASARVRLDQRDELEPGRYSYHSYSKASRPLTLGNTGSAEIRDFYLEHRSERGLTRLGKQQIVWGRLDGIKVLDLINPQDFREFISNDLSESRISLWSAYFDYSFGKWRAEFAVIPDSTGHAIPEQGAWYELTAPRFRFGADNGQGSLPVVSTQPQLSLNDTAIGLRLSRQLGGIDFSAVVYSGIDPEPLGRIATTGSQTVVERINERREAFGFSFDLGLGAAVLRGEYAYQPKRKFNIRTGTQLTSTALDQHRGAIGLDIEGPLGVFINIQYLIDTVAGAPLDLVRPASDRIGTLYMRRLLAYDSLSLEARWYHSFTDNDQRASLNIAYAINDSTSVELGAQFSSGVAEGLFGQFADRDRVTLSLRHTF